MKRKNFLVICLLLFTFSLLQSQQQSYVEQLINNKQFVENVTVQNLRNLDLNNQTKLSLLDYLIPHFENKNDFKKAIELTKFAVEISDESQKYMFTLVSLYKRTNQNDKIEEIKENLISRNRTNFNFYRTFSELFISLGEIDHAITVLKKARQNFNNQTIFFWEFVNLFEGNGDFKSVITEYLNYLNRHNNNNIKNNFTSLINNYNLEIKTIEMLNALSSRSRLLNDLLVELNLKENKIEDAVNIIFELYKTEDAINKLVVRLVKDKHYKAVEKINNQLLENKMITYENYLLNKLDLYLSTDNLDNAQEIIEYLNDYDTYAETVTNRLYRLSSQFYYQTYNFEDSLNMMKKISDINFNDKISIIDLYLCNNLYEEAKNFIFSDNKLKDDMSGITLYYKMILNLLNDNYPDFNVYLLELKNQDIFDIEKNLMTKKLLFLKSIQRDAYTVIKDIIKIHYYFTTKSFEKIYNKIERYGSKDFDEILYSFVITEIFNNSLHYSEIFNTRPVTEKIFNNENFVQMKAKSLYYMLKNEIDDRDKLIEIFIMDDDLKTTIYYNKIVELIQKS